MLEFSSFSPIKLRFRRFISSCMLIGFHMKPFVRLQAGTQMSLPLVGWRTKTVFFGFVKSREKKYTTSPKHNTELLGYGQLGPSFCSSGSVLLLLLYCSSTPPLLQLTAQFPPCRRPSPQQICLLQICLGRLGAYPTYRLADRLGRSLGAVEFWL